MLGPGVPVTSKKGNLDVLKRHYVQLGTCSGRDSFDDSWKEEVDKKCVSIQRKMNWIGKSILRRLAQSGTICSRLFLN